MQTRKFIGEKRLGMGLFPERLVPGCLEYLVGKLESRVCMLIFFADPKQHLLCFFVDMLHQRDLREFLVTILLVDADLIDPQGSPLLEIPQSP